MGDDRCCLVCGLIMLNPILWICQLTHMLAPLPTFKLVLNWIKVRSTGALSETARIQSMCWSRKSSWERVHLPGARPEGIAYGCVQIYCVPTLSSFQTKMRFEWMGVPSLAGISSCWANSENYTTKCHQTVTWFVFAVVNRGGSPKNWSEHQYCLLAGFRPGAAHWNG